VNVWIQFGRIKMLHLFWLIPAVAVFIWFTDRRAKEALGRISEISHRLSTTEWKRRRLKEALFIAALLLIVAASTRPAWNPRPVMVHQEGRDVVFVVDVSRSMLARDLVPNRLERAKLAIYDALDTLEGDRVAVVAFAGTASVVCPLTRDYGFFRWAVETLSPASAESGGTLIGDAIRKVSDDVLDPLEKRYKDIILISDGEDQESFPVEAASAAGQKGVRIIAIGLGDETKGSRIPVTDSSGNTTFLVDNGREVLTRLRPDILREIALATPGGKYLHASTGVFDLGEIYRELIRNREGKDLGQVEITRYREQFQFFLLAVIALLLIESFLGDEKRKEAEDKKEN
jgi:Ca-activated chloride channel family protein